MKSSTIGIAIVGLALVGPVSVAGAQQASMGEFPLPMGEPRSTPHAGFMTSAGGWQIRVHGFAFLGTTSATGPRGESHSLTPSMASVAAMRPLGRGRLSLRLGVSADPTMGARGYPLLLQTGETADGLTPLHDRQHPHDLLTELGLAYRQQVGDSLDGFLYLAAVGQPAFGPVAFMHRASGRELPEAPLGHHLQDATHITNGVLRFGVVSRGIVTLEASLFNGREPDPDRWTPDPIRLDSYSLRALVNLKADWALQASVAHVAQPERLHPTIDETRLSFSATYNRPLRSGNWQTTFAWGRNLTMRRIIPFTEARAIFPAPVLAHYLALAELTGLPADSLDLVFPSQPTSGLLLESALETGPAIVTARAEYLGKREIFDPTDLRHSELFHVGKVSAGAMWQVELSSQLSLGVGAEGSLHVVPTSIQPDYGTMPLSGQLFARLRIRTRMQGDGH